MKDDVLNELKICYDEFQDMLLSNTFINQKKFTMFLDKYNTTLDLLTKDFLELDELTYKKGISILNNGYQIINKRNEKFINTKLDELKKYFDNMFKNIDKDIILDNDQRKAIINDEDYSLILSGAGAGKTTTIIAKVKYLIEKCNIDPNDILLLSYTNKTSEQLKNIINDDFKLNVDILTFHKLGMNILTKRTNKTLQNIGDEKVYKFISDYFINVIFKDKEKLKLFVESFDKYVNFDDSIYEYNNFEDYFNNYINKIYEENKNNLSNYLVDRIQTRIKNNKTIDGKTLRSKQEVIIANYLYKNGYEYEYEKAYPHTDNSYKPDFTIINDKNIYIEYYGLTKLKNNNKFTVDDIRTYNKLIEKKRNLHDKYNTDLIEIYSDYENNSNYIEVLEKELNVRNINHTIKDDKEIFTTLMKTSNEINYFKFISLALNFIKKYKENNYKLNYFDELINKVDEKTKNQLSILKDIYISYNKTIHNKNLVDYDDIINYAYNEIDNVKDFFGFKYIIIDDFQDVSTPRYKLIKKISDLYDAKIIAVGDEWQAIFSFSGSNINLFTDFTKVLGYGDINKIHTTYRNSQELLNVASEFIGKNVNQFNKVLISNKHVEYPVEITYYYKNKGITKCRVLDNLIKSLYNKNKQAKILLLGRYKSDLDAIVESPYFKNAPFNKITCTSCKNADIEFLTIQKAKGLGYDYVIVLNGLNAPKGFPNKSVNNELIKLLENHKEEKIAFAEERKLFYIALTRTKEKVYLLTPYVPKTKRSEFILEITNMDNVKENTNYIKKYIDKEA